MTNEHAALCFAAAAAARWLAGWLARWLAGWPAHHGATQGTTADILQGCSGVGVLLQLNSPQSKPPDETILWCTAACHARTNFAQHLWGNIIRDAEIIFWQYTPERPATLLSSPVHRTGSAPYPGLHHTIKSSVDEY
jgi:hypothetical protein